MAAGAFKPDLYYSEQQDMLGACLHLEVLLCSVE